MTPELQSTIAEILELAGCIFGKQIEPGDELAAAEWAAIAREHLLDRWYRFASFGVTSRADIECLVVECSWVPDDGAAIAAWGGSRTPTLRTSVRLAGTSLEGK